VTVALLGGVRRARRGALVLVILFATQGAMARALDCKAPTGLGPGGVPNVLGSTTAIESRPASPGVTTIAMLPDIQYYSKCALPHLALQTQWLASHALTRNIRAALFMGDLTEHNAPVEWRFVREHLAPGEWQVPMLLAAGNHDHGRNGNAHKRGSLLSRFFPQPPGIAQTALAETRAPLDIENAYYRIALPRAMLGVLVLEWAPRASTVAWANAVLSRYAYDRVIIVTHAYLYDDSTRYDWSVRGSAQKWSPLAFTMARAEARRDPEHDGEMLWNALVRQHAGVFLVLSGHVGGSGSGYLASRGDSGNLVHQVLANYQLLDEGGLGYLRLFEIEPDGRTMRMKTYSPSLGLFATGDSQSGDFVIEPALW
jgi:hypothetical protein